MFHLELCKSHVLCYDKDEEHRRLEGRGVGPTSIDVTDEQISAGEVPVAKRQEEKAQEQNRGIEQVEEESRSSKSKQKSADTVEYKMDS